MIAQQSTSPLRISLADISMMTLGCSYLNEQNVKLGHQQDQQHSNTMYLWTLDLVELLTVNHGEHIDTLVQGHSY